MFQQIDLILYSKPGCHLCEGLEEKLEAINSLNLNLEIRDITTQTQWFNLYQYSIPVLCFHYQGKEYSLPRFSPRTSVDKIAEIIAQQYSLLCESTSKEL